MLGLQMMEYTETGQFWFESDVAKRRNKRRKDRASVTSANEHPDTLDGNHVKRFSSTNANLDEIRFNANVAHRKVKRTSKGDCQYCGAKRVCWYNCSDCNIALHYANNQTEWPCAERFHSCRPQHRRHCWRDHWTKKRPAETFVIDPEVANLRNDTKARQSPPAAGRRTFTVQQAPNPDPSKARTRSASITVVALPASGATSVPN